MKRQLTLCGTTAALCLGILAVFTWQDATFGQQAGGLAGGFSGGGGIGGGGGGGIGGGSGGFGGGGFVDSIDDRLQQVLTGDETRPVHPIAVRGWLARQTSAEDREAAIKKVQLMLVAEFEADMKQRQAELDKIKQRVAEMETVLEKRAAAKDKIVELRLEVLVKEAEGLGWSDEPRRSSPGPNVYEALPSKSVFPSSGSPIESEYSPFDGVR